MLRDISNAEERVTQTVDLIVHGPPVMAEAFLAGVKEAGIDPSHWRLVPKGDDPGVDSMNLLAARPGDGSVLSTCTPVFLQAPLLRGLALTHRQLSPIARLVSDRYLLVVRADATWQTAADFLAHIRREPTRTGGYFRGGINHLLALNIAHATGAQVEFVLTPSEPDVWTALINGQIDWGVGVGAELLPHLQTNALHAIATLDSERLPRFPDLPTLGEAGVEITFALWRGLMGPPALSAAQQAHWHNVARTVTRTEAWQTYLRTNGQADAFLTGTAFEDVLDEQWDWYAHHFRLAKLL